MYRKKDIKNVSAFSESLGTPVDPNEVKKQAETVKSADGQDELNEFFQGQVFEV